MTKPPCLVWLPMDHRMLGDHEHQAPYLVLGDKYARAVKVGMQSQPVLFPLAQAQQIGPLLNLVDGVMLTGSPSNVHPSNFDEMVSVPDLPLDVERDSLTLALINACVAQHIPLLGICRGFQEINVAMGGTLHQRVHLVPGLMDHREPENVSIAQQYGQVGSRRRLIRCTGKESVAWHRVCAHWVMRPMDWWRPLRWWGPGLLPTQFSGTLSGSAGKLLFTRLFLTLLVRLVAHDNVHGGLIPSMCCRKHPEE
jgi:putative glutamine amidotransferase